MTRVRSVALAQGVSESEFQNVDSKTSVAFFGLRFDRVTRQFIGQATITNTSTEILSMPIYLVINSITPYTVTVSNAHGTTSQGHPFYDVSNLIPEAGLGPGETSTPLLLMFINPQMVYFTIDPSVYITSSVAILVSLDVSPESVTIVAGASQQLNVLGHYSDGSSSDLTASSSGTSYTSQNLNVATISSEGLITAVSVVETTITVQNGQITAQVPVTVTGAVTDITPPVVTITGPTEGEVTNTSPITVTGAIFEAADLTTVLVNGQAATIAGTKPNFTFNLPIDLGEGENPIQVIAQDGAGNEGQAQVAVITSPDDGLQTYSSAITITGTVDDATATVSINGTQVTVSTQEFIWEDYPLTEGSNEIIASAQDPAGNTSSIQITVTYVLLNPPQVNISSPADGTVVAKESISVTGTVDDPTATVKVNNISATIDNEGNFEVLSVPAYNEGSNIISAVAVNPAGQGQDSITIIRDITAPVITLTNPQEGAVFNTQSIDVTGTIDDPQAQITVNGYQAVIENGVFTVFSFALTEGENQLTITAQDSVGNSSQIIAKVILDTTAPIIQITGPTQGETTNTSPITVTGTIYEEAELASVLINNQTATIAGTSPKRRISFR